MNNTRRSNRGRSKITASFRNMNISNNIRVNKMSKQANSVTPFRVRAKTQMVSVPNHNYQLKVRKVFRIFSASPTNVQQITTTSILAAIQNELGIDPSTTGGEIVGVHDIRAYYTVPTPGTLSTNLNNTLTVALLDIEEPAGSGNSNFTSLYEDVASPAGICHISAVFPVNNRPTFSRITPVATMAIITSQSLGLLVVDMDITYTRTPSVTN